MAQAIEGGYRAPLPGDTGQPLRAEDFSGEDLRPLAERFLTANDSFEQFMGVILSLLACDDSLIPKVADLATKPSFDRRDLAMLVLAVNRTDAGVQTLKSLLHNSDPTTADMAAKAVRLGYNRSPEWHGKPLLPDDFDASFREAKAPEAAGPSGAPVSTKSSPASLTSPAKPGEISSGLSLKIHSLASDPKVGDEIPIQFSFHNDSTEEYTWQDGDDYRFQLTVKTPAGVVVAAPHYNYGPSSNPGSFFGCSHGAAGGGSFEQNIPLNRWAEITEPGKYVVTAVYHPANVANKPVADVVAEPITITVLPPPAGAPVRRRPGTLPASPEWAKSMSAFSGERSSVDQLAIWQLIANFEDISFNRPQLLEQAGQFLKTYPDSQYAVRAREISDRLKIMIGEDAAHTNLTDEQLAALPVEQRIAELIFRLRDQNGEQLAQPGACDFFDDIGGSTNTAAHQLLRIGYPAVPQLIDALSDKTYTRSVGYGRNFFFSHHVMTVGDCALAILQRMSGASFYVRQTTSSSLSRDGNAEDVKATVREWYGKVQNVGEKETLIQATETGEQPAFGQASLLLQRYPDSAEDAIITGIRAEEKRIREQIAADPSSAHFTVMAPPGQPDNAATIVLRNQNTHLWLIGLLTASSFQDTKLNDFMEGEATNGIYMPSQMEAAKWLLQRGNSNVLEAKIKAWKTGDQQPGPLSEFLASADSPEAIKALGQSLGKLGPLQRRNMIESIGGYPIQPPKQSPATLAAVEAVLVAELDDTEAVPSAALYRTPEREQGQGLRYCDLAEAQLARRWPDKYNFDLFAPLAEREQWRSKARATR